jgi:hypothetical protein
LSISSLIASYGKSVTVRRDTMTRSTPGGPAVASSATTAVTVLLQVTGGSNSLKWGGDRASYDAVAYAEDGTDIREGDYITYVDETASTRLYRVDTTRIPDERPAGDGLRYVIVGMSEDRPRS